MDSTEMIEAAAKVAKQQALENRAMLEEERRKAIVTEINGLTVHKGRDFRIVKSVLGGGDTLQYEGFGSILGNTDYVVAALTHEQRQQAMVLRDNMYYVNNEVFGHSKAVSYRDSMPVRVFVQFYDQIITALKDERDIDVNDPDFATEEPGFADLIAYMSELVVEERKRVEKSLESGRIEFKDLVHLYKKGAKVVVGEGEFMFAGVVENTKIVETAFYTYLNIETRIIHNVGGVARYGTISMVQGNYVGLRSLDELDVRLLDHQPRQMAQLVKRGEKFRKYSANPNAYVSYAGQMYRRSWMSTTSYRADGRIMLDPGTFARLDNDQFRRLTRDISYEEHSKDKIEHIPDDELFMCFNQVFGFSFRAKNWGMFLLENVSDIKWSEDSFDKLVLPEAEKEVVKALVEHNGDSFNDIIEGKGGGVIFMLHGEPGQGKTLTAETVAELLHRPLYSVSVGELGTAPEDLEERLREILDVASVWNAVLLLDEADIFLEARDERDILRNAMVGVFLRLLEYHQGVLFLTTNRVKNIDRAFHSRISLSLAFDGGDKSKREKIWRNLLDAAGVKLSERDVERLADNNVNGRQIKNIIRLSQTLAKSKKLPVTYDRIASVLEMSTRFEREMVNAREFQSKTGNANVTALKERA